MTNEREKIAGTKTAAMYRVEKRFNGRLAGKYFELETYERDRVGSTKYEAFMDCWAAYLTVSGWKDPGA